MSILIKSLPNQHGGRRESRVGRGGKRNVSVVDMLPKKLNFYESVEAKADEEGEGSAT